MTSPKSDTTKEAASGDDEMVVSDAVLKTSKRHSERHDLPNAVNKAEDLDKVPDKYLSGDPKKPLVLKVAPNESYTYALNPVKYCVLAILTIEGLERLAYYGINNTETEFLTGAYNDEWNPGLSPSAAAAFTSSSVAIAYTTPFLGGIIADGAIGK